MRLATDSSREFRDYLGLRLLHFDDVGLDRAAPDDEVWRFCQRTGYYLLSANRNEDSGESLEATMRREGRSDSLAVLTLADAEEIFRSAAYLYRVVERLIDYLLNQDAYRGA